MKMPIYVRLTLYVLAITLFRIIYVFTAYSMGFGSATDHTKTDIVLNITFIICNLICNYLILCLSKTAYKKELLIVSSLTLILWIAFYIYYN